MLRWLAVGLALATCESAPQPTGVAGAAMPELRDHRAHGDAAAHLQEAIALGRLADAREQALWLATTEMDSQASWQPYLVEIRAAAYGIARADDVASAGAGMGRHGRACGSCHDAMNASPSVALVSAPADESTLAAQGQRQQWAAARMWEGVLGAGDQRWLDGANVLATTHLDIASSVHEKPNAETFALAERLREQAAQATMVVEPAERAEMFGQIMETCGSCHRILRPAPSNEKPRAVAGR